MGGDFKNGKGVETLNDGIITIQGTRWYMQKIEVCLAFGSETFTNALA